MAQQIQGGGVTFDAGAGVRDAGRLISDAGNQLLQNMTARKNTMVQAAEQARVAFFNNAQLTGMTPQQYAATVGAEEYKRMVEAQGQAANAETVFGNFLKTGKVDSQGMLENFSNLQNATEETRMRMDSANIEYQKRMLADRVAQPQMTQGQPGNNAPQNLQGAGQQAVAPQIVPPVPSNVAPALQGNNFDASGFGSKGMGESGPWQAMPGTANQIDFAPERDPRRELTQNGIWQNTFNQTPASQENLARMQSAGAPLAKSGAPLSASTTPATPPPKPMTVEQQLAGAPDTVRKEAAKIDSANAVAKAAADKIATEAKKTQLAAKGIDSKKTPALESLIISKGNARVEKADNATLAKEILNVQDAEGLRTELLESSSRVFPTGDVTQSAVPLGATPFAEKTIARSVEKANESSDAVVTKGEELLSKTSTGYRITDKDIAAFKQILNANKGNYAKTLSQLNPELSNALSERAIAEVMSMDSVRAQVAGLGDVANRKAAQEQLSANIEMVKMQMAQKATGAKDLSQIFTMYNQAQQNFIKKLDLATNGGKISAAEAYKADGSLLTEANNLSMLGAQLTGAATGGALLPDPPIISLSEKGFWFWKKPVIESTTFGAQAAQANQTTARQGAVATPKSTAGTDYINKKF